MKNVLLSFLMMASFLFGEKGESITGFIQDANSGLPLSDVNIIIESQGIGTTSDHNGHFNLGGLSIGENKLAVTHIGYEPQWVKIIIPASSSINIAMKQKLIQMDAIVTTGTRTERYLSDVPVTTQVIKGDRLRETGAADISQLIEETTGINVEENQFGTGVNLMGFDTEHILIMIDGMKMIGRVNGQLDIAQIPIEQIDRIEIVKGATSALYGSEAMGGVINIFTQNPVKNWSLQSDGSFGAFGRINQTLNLSRHAGHWQWSLGGGYRHYGGYDLDPKTIYEEGSDYEKTNYDFRVGKQLSKDSRLRFESHFLTEEQNLITSHVFKERSLNKRYSGRVEYLHQNIFNAKLKSFIDYATYAHKYDWVVRKSGNIKEATKTTDDLTLVGFHFEKGLNRHGINGGFEYNNEKIVSNKVLWIHRNSKMISSFFQDEFSINDQWTLLSGLRYDYHSIYGSHTSPKISIMFKPEMISRIRLSYGQGFRSPSFKELYYTHSNITVGYNVKGNEALRPETSQTVHLDIERWHTQKYHARVNIFYNQIRDMIDFKYDAMIDGITTYTMANLSRAWTRGVELDFTYFIFENTELWLGYALLDSRDEEQEKNLSMKAKHKANGGIRYTFNNGIKTNLRFQYMGKRFYWDDTAAGVADGQTWIDDYTIVNGHISFPLPRKIRGYFGVKNLTDTVDPRWGPMPGREWYAGLRINLLESIKK
ncbi:MAG: TonB-dependent receptor [Candidatus Marinimicrobia bacterium]|nr:TonB-dependent receptor [Candidatus Neomarinimicrobiota bacterium]